ncbi:MAG: SpoIIE family protein phosphatase [Bacteroidia bacterium]|nr:SpoIIE family protein phosphatase [Bacteroidia bacterium]
MIDATFSVSEKQKSALSTINTLTIQGNYEEAKKQINQLKSNKTSSLFLSAIYTYEASILYNQSNYKKCIELCDSTIFLLKNEPNNAYQVKALNLKAKALASLDEFDNAIQQLHSAKIIAEKNNDAYGLSIYYYLKGSVYADKGLFEKSTALFDSSLTIKKKINDELGEAACYSFLGLNNSFMGNYSIAISFIQKSITIRDKIGDKRGLANSYLNLYRIYYGMGETDKALSSEFKSLEICAEINDLQCVSGRYTNIGQLYQLKGEYNKALEYQFKALDISNKLGLKIRTALIHENIARVFIQQNKLEKAFNHIDTSFVIRQELNDDEGLTSIYYVMALYHNKKNDHSNTIKFATLSLEKSIKLKLPFLSKDAHELLSKAYYASHPKEALEHYKAFIILRDSIYNIEKTKEITRKELEFDFAKKEQVQKIEQEQKLSIINQEKEQAALIRNISILFLIIVITFLIIAIRANKIKHKAQKELEFANKLLHSTNRELKENNQTIEHQKQTIEYKNREITDSIKYAFNIQSALIPKEDEFANYFKEAFVLFKPKDIISGDFYWITEVDNKIIYATGDCTGHGVPGGFMSMLGISLLNEVVNEHELTDPALILSRLRKKVIKALRQKGLYGEHQDGMDMILCVLDKTKKELLYAAANRPLYIVSKNNGAYTLKEHKGDNQPVGIYGKELKPFKQFTISLNDNDILYTFSDGYADQFGGPNGKKFKYKQMQELFLSIAHLPLNEQKSIIDATFYSWKQNIEQVDDVCVVGIKI